VADINTDMFLPIVPLKTLLVLGIDESTLGAQAVKVAESVGVKAIPDRCPYEIFLSVAISTVLFCMESRP
jgi:hypothetical protein